MQNQKYRFVKLASTRSRRRYANQDPMSQPPSRIIVSESSQKEGCDRTLTRDACTAAPAVGRSAREDVDGFAVFHCGVDPCAAQPAISAKNNMVVTINERRIIA
jgi:hypothetical protein